MVKAYGATFLVDRTEIAEAMNFNKYPVLWMEVGKPKDGWDPFTVYEGCKARIVHNTSRYGDLIHTGLLSMYGDEQRDEVRTSPFAWDKIQLSNDCTCLHSCFGYRDVMEELENAQSPLIKPSQEVIVVMKDSTHCKCWVRKMVTGDSIDPYCQTIITLRNLKEE